MRTSFLPARDVQGYIQFDRIGYAFSIELTAIVGNKQHWVENFLEYNRDMYWLVHRNHLKYDTS